MPATDQRGDVQAFFGDQLHPSIWGVLQFFDAAHLPAHLKAVVEPFVPLANEIARRSLEPGVSGPETTVALRKLLEAKDCAVRAVIAGRTPS